LPNIGNQHRVKKMNWIMLLAVMGHTMGDLVANAVSAT
jgi:hypothetical protein